jgi:hypothetical protein
MATEDVNVSIDDAHLGRFDEVVRQVERAGLKVQQRLAVAGVVSGSIDADKLSELERVPGVAAVERSREVHIPPGEIESR